MASVLNKTTSPADYRISVHTPDFPSANWYIDPDISAVVAVPTKYWKIGTNPVTEMNQTEKDAVDAAIVSAAKTAAKTAATNGIDGNEGYDLRGIAKVVVDEINVLRQWLASFKTETAAATNLSNFQSRVAGLPATPDRTLAQAKTAYKNLISGSSLDE